MESKPFSHFHGWNSFQHTTFILYNVFFFFFLCNIVCYIIQNNLVKHQWKVMDRILNEKFNIFKWHNAYIYIGIFRVQISCDFVAKWHFFEMGEFIMAWGMQRCPENTIYLYILYMFINKNNRILNSSYLIKCLWYIYIWVIR